MADVFLSYKQEDRDRLMSIYNFKSHIVVFREEIDHIAITRVRHGGEDWASDVEDET